jgi:hypothetical protein
LRRAGHAPRRGAPTDRRPEGPRGRRRRRTRSLARSLARSQACISYATEHASAAARRRALRDTWRFECACARCAPGGSSARADGDADGDADDDGLAAFEADLLASDGGVGAADVAGALWERGVPAAAWLTGARDVGAGGGRGKMHTAARGPGVLRMREMACDLFEACAEYAAAAEQVGGWRTNAPCNVQRNVPEGCLEGTRGYSRGRRGVQAAAILRESDELAQLGLDVYWNYRLGAQRTQRNT